MTSNDESEAKDQEVRAELRQSFLRAVSELIDHPCNILTYEQSLLKATFAGWNPDGGDIMVRDLETPASVKIEAALLRSPDVLAIQFEGPLELS